MATISLDATFGCVFIGVIIGAVLYGVSCAQVFYYFQHYSEKDGRGTKAVVIATLVADTVHQALISHAAYTYTITFAFQPLKLITLVWSPVVAIFPSGIVAFLVQIFYAVRIWRFSEGNVIITATLSLFIAGQFVASLIYISRAINMTMLADIAGLRSLSIITSALAAAGDVLITVVFCILLRRARTNLQRSNRMINLLIVFSVQTGMITSLCAVASLISIIVSPNTFIYMAFYFLLGRLYCNSLLATLNVRDSIRERGHASLGISLNPIDMSNSSSAANRKEIDIKASIAGAGVGAHGSVKSQDGNGPSPFVPSMTHTDTSQVV